jgi:predicted RNase H-like HicB family nuclease
MPERCLTQNGIPVEFQGIHMKSYRLSVIVEKDKNGYYAFAPDFQGCYSQGDSHEEALENIKDAIRLHIEDLLDRGDSIDVPESVSLTSLEIAV